MTCVYSSYHNATPVALRPHVARAHALISSVELSVSLYFAGAIDVSWLAVSHVQERTVSVRC